MKYLCSVCGEPIGKACEDHEGVITCTKCVMERTYEIWTEQVAKDLEQLEVRRKIRQTDQTARRLRNVDRRRLEYNMQKQSGPTSRG